METLTDFAQSWLLCGCVGLVILLGVSTYETYRPVENYPNGITNPFEMILLAIALMIFPLLGPFAMALAINKVIEVKDGQ